MKKLLRALGAVGATALVAGFLVAGFVGSASAADTPPWEPVGNPPEAGGLLFFNSEGQPVTGGSIDTAQVAPYVEGTSSLSSDDDTVATLDAYTPVDGVPAGQWSGEQLSGSTTYPNPDAPSPLNTSALPVVTGSADDNALLTYIESYPNRDTSDDGYAGLYVLRVYTSGTDIPKSTSYDSADISITSTNGTWSVVYDPITYTATTVSLAATPSGSDTYGDSVGLDATISPAVPAGTVQFEDNGQPLGSPVAETDGSASTTTGDLGVTLPAGTDDLDAVFTPAAAYAYYDGSSTATESPAGTVDYDVTPIGTSTTISSTSPASPQLAGTSVTIDASVTDGDGSTPAGTVAFQYQVGGSGPETEIGTQSVADGSASISTTSLPVGTDDLSAVFTPGSGDYATSTSSPVAYTIQPPPGDTTITALTVDPTSGTAYDTTDPVALEASVTDSTTTATTAAPAGTVSFYDNGATDSDAVTDSSVLLGQASVGSDGTASISYPIGPAGSHYIVAVYGSSNLDDWAGSTSQAVEFTATASTPAPDAQNLQVDIPAGALTITTPYTPTSPFSLGTATLDAGDGTFTASAPFGSSSDPEAGVTITDTGVGEGTWTASAEATNFTNGGEGGVDDDINAQNLTFTDVTPSYLSGNDYGTANGDIPVDTQDVTNGGTVYPAGASGDEGLAGEPHAFASTTASGGGSVYVDGLLTLVAPSSVTPGQYTATLTFTVA